MFDVNFLAIIVVAILNNILAALWYSPKVFGDTWAASLRLNKEDLQPTPWHFIGAIIISLITAWVIALFVHWLELTTFSEGLEVGFFIWLGFIAANHFSGVIWAKKPLKAYFIDVGFSLLSFLMMTSILASWK